MVRLNRGIHVFRYLRQVVHGVTLGLVLLLFVLAERPSEVQGAFAAAPVQAGASPTVTPTSSAVSPRPYVGTWGDGSAADAAIADDLGTGWGRVTILWNTAEPAPGMFNWAPYDDIIARMSALGRRRVYAVIRDNPAWASPCSSRVTSDVERARLARFVTALVRRYQGTIPDGPQAGQYVGVKYWQLYNEPDNAGGAPGRPISMDLSACFGFATIDGSTPTQAGRDNYARMLEVVGLAVHTTDPAGKVVLGGISSGNYTADARPGCPLGPYFGCTFDFDFLPGVLSSLKAHGTLDRVDAISVHIYSSQTGPSPGGWAAYGGPDLIGRISYLRQSMLALGLQPSEVKPIVVEESSYTDSIGDSSIDPSHPFNQRQREYVIKALSRAAYMQVLAYFWFWTRDPTTCIACCPPGYCPGQDNAYGLLTPNGGQKPSYRAYGYFTHLVNRTEQFLDRLTLPNPKLEGYEFAARDGRRLQIVWNQADRQIVPYAPPFGTAGLITDPDGGPVAPVNGAVEIGAEPRFIFSVTCEARPRVNMAVAPAGTGRLQVPLSASIPVDAPNNRLTKLQFTNANNILIDIPNGPTEMSGPFEVTLPAVTATTFYVRRADPGIASSLATFKVTDGCGEWSSFVGGGPNAFR